MMNLILIRLCNSWISKRKSLVDTSFHLLRDRHSRYFRETENMLGGYCEEFKRKGINSKSSARLHIFQLCIQKSIKFDYLPNHHRISVANKSEHKGFPKPCHRMFLQWFRWIVNYTHCTRVRGMKQASLSCYVLLLISLPLLFSQVFLVNACQNTSLAGT